MGSVHKFDAADEASVSCFLACLHFTSYGLIALNSARQAASVERRIVCVGLRVNPAAYLRDMSEG